jgi:hypothetical protein
MPTEVDPLERVVTTNTLKQETSGNGDKFSFDPSKQVNDVWYINVCPKTG